ncbi:MAG: hypothetical protein ACM3SM_07560 [Bacteroidota bacterium]
MARFKGFMVSSLIVAAAGVFTLTGCGGVSEEQMAQLNTLRQEVSTLNNDVTALRGEKTRFEREIGEKNAKLEQCARDTEETRRNLENLPK